MISKCRGKEDDRVKMLIADDNESICEILRTFAEAAGFVVSTAGDGKIALHLFRQQDFDIVLLDVMMPELDGFEVCRSIREQSNVPVIMITARGEDYERIMGLDIGADDYVVKPFSAQEVMARVRAVLRRLDRMSVWKENIIFLGNLRLFLDSCRGENGQCDLNLTKKEFDILCLLAEHPGQVFSRSHLLDSLWGYDYEGDNRTVDSHIKRLRYKLTHSGTAGVDIQTVWGRGYRLEVMK